MCIIVCIIVCIIGLVRHRILSSASLVLRRMIRNGRKNRTKAPKSGLAGSGSTGYGIHRVDASYIGIRKSLKRHRNDIRTALEQPLIGI